MKDKTIVWECTYCPTIGKAFRVSHVEYTHIIFDPGCPNCKQPWAHFKHRVLEGKL